MKKTKLFLIVCASVFALGGTYAYQNFIPASQAAEEHGDGHGHEKGEEAHDEGGEEHGHGHEEKGHDEGGEHEEEGHDEGGHAEEGIIKLDAAQLQAAGIKIATTASGTLAKEVNVPGKIVAAADRMAQIVPKVEGIVTEAKKNLGDTVKKGEVLALIESREMAEAVADYLAAKRGEELARTTYEREKSLWDKKITAEQDYLNAKNEHQAAKIQYDLTRQKLRVLGHNAETLKQYDSVEAADKLRFHELRSPLDGRVISRELTLGEFVDSTHSAFTVADLSVVWVEINIAPSDLPFIEEGQQAIISGSGGKAGGKLVFISPAIDPETRSAKAIIELDNAEGHWRPGDFANAAIATSAQNAGITLPKEAVQSIEGQNVVFVQSEKGFEKRAVGLGREDSGHVEIVSGLQAGEQVAISGTFTLKAEFGKAEAEHSH
jgi:cobalt-zinc-cadmium efflux system membrane fusion protein